MHKYDSSGPTTLKSSSTFRLCPCCTGVDSMDKACRAGRSEASLQRGRGAQSRSQAHPVQRHFINTESENLLEKTFATTDC